MEEPSPRSSRLALAGALMATIVVGGAGFLLGRGTAEPVPAAPVPPVAAPVPEKAPEPVSTGVLGRSDLIALAAAAADAAAAGRDAGQEIGQADGRRFELRLPFGCNGPSGEKNGAATGWRYDKEAGVLRIHVAPVTWAASDWWPAEAAKSVETVEGFWIERPWTASESCPEQVDRPVAAGAEPATLPGQTLAVGQVFSVDGGRSGRRDGKPYDAVVRIQDGELQGVKGFRIRISGRIARAGDLGLVRCRQPAGPEQRPICLVSVVMDEVALENAAGDEVLATWSLTGGNRPDG